MHNQPYVDLGVSENAVYPQMVVLTGRMIPPVSDRAVYCDINHLNQLKLATTRNKHLISFDLGGELFGWVL